MTVADATESLMVLLGGKGDKARRGALLLATVLCSHLPELPQVVVDEEL